MQILSLSYKDRENISKRSFTIKLEKQSYIYIGIHFKKQNELSEELKIYLIFCCSP